MGEERERSAFRYRDTVKVGLDPKPIVNSRATTASISDVKAAEGTFDEKDETAYGDSAYPSMQLPEGVINEKAIQA